jgi:hypothetical protein
MSTFTLNVKKLDALLKALSTMTQEAVFHIEKDCLRVSAWGTSNYHALRFSIPIESSMPGDCGVVEHFGVKLEDVKTALKGLEEATIAYNGQQLKVTSGKKSRTLSVYDEQTIREFTQNPHEGASSFTLTFKELAEAIKEATLYCDTFKMESSGICLLLKGEEDGVLNASSTILEISCAKASCHYKASQIVGKGADLTPLLKEFKNVTVKFDTDHPLSLTFEEDGVTANYFLAPIELRND